MSKTDELRIIFEAIREAKEQEREACAKEADYYAANSGVARNIAAAIRARGAEGKEK